MIDRVSQKRLMMQYLFGELSAEECSAFEEAYLKDSDIFQELVALENEMTDRYVLGELSGPARQKFERSFLDNPARGRTIETAKSLLAYAAATEDSTLPHLSESEGKDGSIFVTRLWRTQLVAAAIFFVMIGGMFWLILTQQRMNKQLEQLWREQATAAQEQKELRQQVGTVQYNYDSLGLITESPANTHGAVSFTLGPGVSRGNGEITSLVIPAPAVAVILHMNLGHDSHAHYSLSLRTADGRLIWRYDNIQGRQTDGDNKEISVTIPSHLLQNGDYAIRISTGREDVGDNLAGYSFHVIRR